MGNRIWLPLLLGLALCGCKTFFPVRSGVADDPFYISPADSVRARYSAGGTLAFGGDAPGMISINPRVSISRQGRHWMSEGFAAGYFGSAEIKMNAEDSAFSYLDGKKSFAGFRTGANGALHWRPGRFVLGMGLGAEYYIGGGRYEDFRDGLHGLSGLKSRGGPSDIGITLTPIAEFMFDSGNKFGVQPFILGYNLTSGGDPLMQLGSHFYRHSGRSMIYGTLNMSGGGTFLGFGYRRVFGS